MNKSILRLAAASALACCVATPAFALSGWNDPGPLTRQQVREALRIARAAGTMSPSGEIGDTEAVLAARENFNALQAEVMMAEYWRAEERLAALTAQDRDAAAQPATDISAAAASADLASAEMLA
jgi:hypothetical protein